MCISRRRHALRAPGRDILILLTVLLAAGVVGGPARTLLPVYLEQDLAWGPPAIAALAAARLIAGACSAPLGGILSDRAGPRRTLWLGLAGLPLAALVFLTPAAPVLLLLALAVGLAEGLQATGSQTYLVARADSATIGVAASAFFIGGTLGGALGNLGAGALLRGAGFPSLGPVGLVVGLLVLGAAAALPGSAPRQGRRQAIPIGTLAAYRRLLGIDPVRQLALLRFLSTCSWGTVSLLWPLLIARLGHDPAAAALFGTVSLTLAVAAQLATGRLIDAIGPGGPAVVLAALTPPIAGLSAVAAAVDSAAALFTVGVLGTAVAWSLSGTTLPLVRVIAPAEQTGQVVGLLHLLWSLAMLTGTALADGLVIVGMALPFWVVTLLSLPAAIAAHRLWRALRPPPTSA